MKKFKNRVTGTVMRVDDSRVEEYIRLGHTLIEDPKPAPKPEKKPVRKAAKK